MERGVVRLFRRRWGSKESSAERGFLAAQPSSSHRVLGWNRP